MINLNKIIFVIALFAPSLTFATNGYFMIGYGAKSIGLGGAGVALPQDRLVGAINPAGMAYVEDGFDAGIRVLAAVRNASIDCRGVFACDQVVKDRSARDLFLIPNFGWKRSLSEKFVVGVTVYGNGGINTTYGRAFYDESAARILGGNAATPGFPRTGKFGVDFTQLYIAPSVSWKFHPAHTLGISPILAMQRFSIRGLESFERLSADPSSTSSRGTDYEVGGGVRIGWVGDLTSNVRLGAQFTSRIWTGRLTKYNGLLANGGEMEAPPHWTIGGAWDATEKLTLVFDYQRILFGSIDALSNPGPTAAELGGAITAARRLGGSHGIGFGWNDQSVFKFGARYEINEQLTLRTGWNHGSSQIPNREALLNIIAPATINDNATVGGSWEFSGIGELSFAYMYAFKKTNHDRSSEFFGTAVRHSIYEHSLDFSWSKNF
ncbi:MAG: long-chain fatty acid transport protein [Gammaproteobacteria bacterium]|jgi:long-chain fatty acid transport protein